jgi:hypothetical protein
MIGSIDEEENLIYLSEYEKKFILGKVYNDQTSDNQSYLMPANSQNSIEQARDKGLIDTDKIPSIRLFRMFKKHTSSNSQNEKPPFTNFPMFNHIERKKILTESFNTTHLFSSVLESVSALPTPKQIRTKNNKRKNVVDTILLYDTRFNHDSGIEEKAKLRTKEIVKLKEKEALKERELKSSRSESKSIYYSVEELGDKSNVQIKDNIAKKLQSKSVHFSDDEIILGSSKGPSQATTRNDQNKLSSAMNSDEGVRELVDISLSHANNEKLYNRFKRTKKIVPDSKDNKEPEKIKVKFSFSLNLLNIFKKNQY